MVGAALYIKVKPVSTVSFASPDSYFLLSVISGFESHGILIIYNWRSINSSHRLLLAEIIQYDTE